MRALVKERPGPGLRMIDMPEPEICPRDVLVRVRRTGICGTDLHIDAWDEWARRAVRPPLVVGHEFAGEIAAVGPAVEDLGGGELVSGEGHIVCGRCRRCMAGRRHLCVNARGVGVHRPGAFAEYIALPAQNVWRHDSDVDHDLAAIFDPLGNAVHAALAFPVLGEEVLITGAGPIGLMALAVVRHAGARHVVITDINEYRLALAPQMGATLALDARSGGMDEACREIGIEEGFAVGLEMSGSAAGLADLVAHTAHGGSIALLGFPGREAAIDWQAVVFKMLTIRGIYGREMFETWYAMSAMLDSGLDIDRLITHRFGADDYQEAFRTAREGEAGKIVLDWAR